MLLAESSYEFGHLLWSLLLIFFMVIYFMIIFSIFGDLFRSKDLSGVAKALWVIGIFLFFLIGPLVYLIVRGSGMSHRAAEANEDAQKQMHAYEQQFTASPTAAHPTEQITQAKALLDSGAITQDEFEKLKAKALD